MGFRVKFDKKKKIKGPIINKKNQIIYKKR